MEDRRLVLPAQGGGKEIEMIIAVFILTMFGTICACVISIYAVYLSSQVSGEKLLTLNSELGYKYATTYQTWQMAAVISVIAAVVLWIIFIVLFVRRRKKKKHKEGTKNCGNM